MPRARIHYGSLLELAARAISATATLPRSMSLEVVFTFSGATPLRAVAIPLQCCSPHVHELRCDNCHR